MGRFRDSLLVLLAFTALSCGPSRDELPLPSAPDPEAAQISPEVMQEFHRLLAQEPGASFEESPPKGLDSFFDFKVEVMQGTDPNLHEAVLLSWSGTLPGDANLDGEVNLADVAFFSRFVGLSWWEYETLPSRPGGQRAVFYFNALDSSGNAVVDAPDLVAIARHYRQIYDGYRVYRRQIGNDDWELLPNRNPDEQQMSISKDQAAYQFYGPYRGLGAPQFLYYDLEAPDLEIEYTIVPWCEGSQSEGQCTIAKAVRPYSSSVEVPEAGVFAESQPPYLVNKPIWLWITPTYNLVAPISWKLELDNTKSTEHFGEMPDPPRSLYRAISFVQPGLHTIRIRSISGAGFVDYDDWAIIIHQ